MAMDQIGLCVWQHSHVPSKTCVPLPNVPAANANDGIMRACVCMCVCIVCVRTCACVHIIHVCVYVCVCACSVRIAVLACPAPVQYPTDPQRPTASIDVAYHIQAFFKTSFRLAAVTESITIIATDTSKRGAKPQVWGTCQGETLV